MRRLSLLPLALLLACSSSPAPPTNTSPDVAQDTPDAPPDAEDDAPELPPTSCSGRYGTVTQGGAVEDQDLDEASGLAASRANPGVLWSHNDSGDTARLFALSTEGANLGRLSISGVRAVDFEDIAAAACPGGEGACLYVADMGNNDMNRQNQTLYVVREPAVSIEHPLGERALAPLFTVPLRFNGESIDAEALMVAPDGSAVYVLEKVDAPTFRVFAAAGPLVNGQPLELRPVATVPSPGFAINHGYELTGADLHPSGARLVIRLYVGSWEYRMDEGQTPADLASITPIAVAAGPLSEPQGEAITYDHAGTGVWTVSELSGEEPPLHLHHVPCR